MRAIAPAIHKIVKPLARRHGFADARILSQWSRIVGDDMARHVKPVKISNNMLTVAVADSNWAMQVSYKSPILVEMINRYFGFAAIKKIKTLQSYFTVADHKKKMPITPDTGARIRAEAQTRDVKDDGLRAALQQLGEVVEMQVSQSTKKTA